MHWESHVSAFYAQWVCRYMDPRRAPWKEVLDFWLADRWQGGRTAVLDMIQEDGAKGRKSIAADLPPRLSYFRRCVQEFEALAVRRLPEQYGPEVQSESLFNNRAFEIPLDHFAAQAWQTHLECFQIEHLFDPETRDFFTAENWEEYFFGMAPPHIRGTPAAHEFAKPSRPTATACQCR